MRRCGVRFVADVAGVGQDFLPRPRQFARRLLQRPGRARAEHDVMPGAHESLRDGPPDAEARPGDDDVFRAHRHPR